MIPKPDEVVAIKLQSTATYKYYCKYINKMLVARL